MTTQNMRKLAITKLTNELSNDSELLNTVLEGKHAYMKLIQQRAEAHAQQCIERQNKRIEYLTAITKHKKVLKLSKSTFMNDFINKYMFNFMQYRSIALNVHNMRLTVI
ncbi:hypothetical protein ACN1NW_000415 [Acinetobacter baumannii]|nr:hypothetical protein [Acinetobacter baumannii]ELA7031004.1 hypothetical protein [Acinetobacter baumannii]ELA7118767.1 hypothetical protein [Acinetobacter baumannii]ELB0919716.1 hypothetical protein [Acinetobacter baumannii]ELB0965892.1 hypothetical protein [Acinetobacter baumannii]